VKTISLKKVSAVAVASLGFGLLSVVPANAAGIATVGSIYASKYSVESGYATRTATLTTDGTTTVAITNASTSTFVAGDIGKGLYTAAAGYIGTIVAYTNSVNATSAGTITLTAAPVSALTTATGAYVGKVAVTKTASTIINANGINAMSATAGSAAALVLGLSTAEGATAGKGRLLIDSAGQVGVSAAGAATQTQLTIPFTVPSVAGVYPATIQYNDTGTFDGVAANQLEIKFTLTVTADSSFSADVSTVYVNDDMTETDANTTAATTALGASGPSTNDAAAAVIWFNAYKANGTVYSGGTFYAYMTGPGKLDIDGTTYVRSESAANDGNHYVKVVGDGTSGTGTVVMYMILADGVTKVNLPSRTVSFYGSVAKLEATVVQGIATAGVANGACGGLTDCTYATLAEKPAVLIKATDANGVLVPGLAITGTTSDGTVIASSAVSEGTGATDYNGRGYYNASVTGGSITGKSANVTYSTTLSSGTVISATAVSIANAGTPKTVTWALDKTAYEPGALVLITVTAKDANGNAAADGTYANLFAGATTASGSITGSTPAASVELVGGKKEYKAFAPGTGGSYTITNTTGTSVGATAGTVLTGTVTVTNPNAALLTQIDALNAKIVALNALIAKIMKKLGVR